MTDEDVAEASSPADRLSFWRRSPGRLFHLVLIVPALAWLWSWSWPGGHILLWLPALLVLAIGGLVWSVRLSTYLVARSREHRTTGGRWFLVAPICGVLLLALVIVDVPLKIRWTLSRSDFEDVVDQVSTDDQFDLHETRRLGHYRVLFIEEVGDALIFHEETPAGFVNDAGFAYLPNGPFPELENGGFENPKFRHLGGPWYAWTASW